MEWSPDPGQERTLKDVKDWLKSSSPLFILYGYAGTGKTTLIQRLVEDFRGEVRYCAPTGKAASIMRRKGCYGASTGHSAIYMPADEARQRIKDLRIEHDGVQAWIDELRADRSNPFNPLMVDICLMPELTTKGDRLEGLRRHLHPPRWIKRGEIKGEPQLIVVDEAPMVSKEVARDLMSFGIKVLAVGDPAQLPPIGRPGPFYTDRPDAMLTTIHRHARESAVLRMATIIREGGRLPFDEYHTRCRSLDDDQVQAMMRATDQIIVGLNRTRHEVNAIMRGANGFAGTVPNRGERLMCFHNNHRLGLLNGTNWGVVTCIDTDDRKFFRVCLECLEEPEDDEEVEPVNTIMHRQPFEGGRMYPEDELDADHFEFGYSVTCHKSQGSQWDSVLIFDDWFWNEEHQRWLYTAVTRGAKEARVVSINRRW